MNQPKHVLDGYKVLDFSHIVAGPTCTLMLAEMGAEVIKVELAPAGDGARLGPILIEGRSGYFVQLNRGKKDLCLDAKTPEDLDKAGQHFARFVAPVGVDTAIALWLHTTLGEGKAKVTSFIRARTPEAKSCCGPTCCK